MEQRNIRLVRDGEVRAAEPEEGFAVDLPGGLPVYQNPTIEGVESTWADLDSKSDRLHFKRGAVAHVVSVNRVYGQGNLKEFAGRNNVEYSTVLEWVATYRRLLRLSDARRIRVLSLDLRYSHYRALNSLQSHDTYEALLIKAHKRRWNVGRLSSALYAQKIEEGTHQESGAPVAEATASDSYSVSLSYAQAGSAEDEEEKPPSGVVVEADELAEVGAEYERDVIERFLTWLADDGISLVDEEGQIRPFRDLVERYARELL